MTILTRVETGSGHPGHPGQPGHILSGSSGSDPLYKISGSDPDITCVDDGVWLVTMEVYFPILLKMFRI